MKNATALIVLSILLILCYITIFATAGFPQDKDPLRINTAEVVQYRNGNYRIILLLNQGRSDPPDDYFESLLKDPKNYFLREKTTQLEIKLPTVQVGLREKEKVYQISLIDVDIKYRKEYTVGFRKPLPAVEQKDLNFREGEGTDEFEEGKSIAWEKSIKPKISQGDNTVNDLGDFGFELSLGRKLPQKFEFNFDASVTSNKNDPNNHWKLNLYWRYDLWQPSPRFVIRPLTLSLQEDSNQALTLHDLSIRGFASISVHLFNGIQPIFLTAGLDEAVRIARNGEDFDDPRIHLQVQWGMIGLVGRGSGFFINWQYWRRLDNFGNPKIDPSEEKERKYIELEFVLPIVESKNLTVKYADGNVAPTFMKDTSIHIGWEILFSGQRIPGPK